MIQQKVKDYILLQLVIVLWGFTVILGLLIHLPALEVVFYRTGIATIGLLVLVIWSKRPFRVGLRPIGGIAAVGFLIAVHWILFFGAAKVSNASVCLAGMATAAFWTSLIDPLINQRKYRWYETLIGLMVVAGLVVILNVNFQYWIGLLMAIISALMASLFTILNGRLVKKYDHYTITMYEMSGAFLTTAIFLPFSVFFFSDTSGSIGIPDTSDLGWLLVLALVCTVFAYSIGVKVMRSLSPYLVSLSINLEPVYGMVIAVLVFPEKEKMEPWFYVGSAIIIGSLLIYPIALRLDKRKTARVRRID